MTGPRRKIDVVFESHWHIGVAFTAVGGALLYFIRWSVDGSTRLCVRWFAASFMVVGAILLLGIFSNSRSATSATIAAVTVATVVTSLVVTSPVSRRTEQGDGEDDEWNAY